MKKNDYSDLFISMHPGFFEKDDIKNIGDESVYEEQMLLLKEFDADSYQKELDDTVSFGYYEGDFAKLKKLIERVDRKWPEIFSEEDRVYCGFVNGEVASFCIVEDMGSHELNGCKVKIGGPGCVGSLPEYRDKGIALTMVKHVTSILKEEGYDYSYIHYTGVAKWYAKLGYKTVVRWNKHGIISGSCS